MSYPYNLELCKELDSFIESKTKIMEYLGQSMYDSRVKDIIQILESRNLIVVHKDMESIKRRIEMQSFIDNGGFIGERERYIAKQEKSTTTSKYQNLFYKSSCISNVIGIFSSLYVLADMASYYFYNKAIIVILHSIVNGS